MRIYNTLSKKKEDFVPLKEGWVRMYVCGPTVYGLIHVGNARPAIVFDAFRRYLEYRGYKVVMVQNFTDIDDKIINKANDLGVNPQKLADTFIAEYFRDAHSLGIRPANFHPKTTDYVKEIIDTVQKLIDKGYAYKTPYGDVYFSVRKFPKYGELSGKKIEDLIAGARVEPGEEKKDPLDFALWKAAKASEPWWESPWGKGRPGWHIECSAMSTTLLGESFDIHAGGEDLIFPHHENEKAQSEACTGKIFAKYWMHNGMIRMVGEKMSKSLGNIFLVRNAVAAFGRDAIRLFILSKHYRSPIDFSEEILIDNKKAVRRGWEAIERFEKRMNVEIPVPKYDSWMNEQIEKFKESLDDDFNTPEAVAQIFNLIKELNKAMDSGDEDKALKAYHLIKREFGPVLGLFDLSREIKRLEGKESKLIDLLIDIRNKMRKEKRFDIADEIRDKLSEIGIILKDKKEGTEWEEVK
ncbi:MAG: cysteine--tRNA ligase [Thermotogaceae bacterium]|nr:cysteine--tRNA ligase [Thermotogaceae bacterium]